MNTVKLSGALGALDILRYTPAGIPVMRCVLRHESQQVEAGLPRRVECDLSMIALGEPALQLNHLQEGLWVEVEGFLAANAKQRNRPVLHIQSIYLSQETNAL